MLKHMPLFVALLLVPAASLAGPLDDLVGEMSGLDGAAWWVQLVALVSAGAALAAAVLPVGDPGGKWEKIRVLLNAFAANWGSAKNRDE